MTFESFFYEKQIVELLRAHKIPEKIIDIRFTYYRKALVMLEDDFGNNVFVKIAGHPYSMELMANEIAGCNYFRKFCNNNIFRIPEYWLVDKTHQYSIVGMNDLSGKNISFFDFPRQSITQIFGDLETIELKKYLDVLLAKIQTTTEKARLERVADRIIEYHGNNLIPVSPSHGDYIYWNQMKDKQGNRCLFDFEYFSKNRVACYDDWHWFIYPLSKRMIKMDLESLYTTLTKLLPYVFWVTVFKVRYNLTNWIGENPVKTMNLLLTIYLFEHSTQTLLEHQIPDIRLLIGEEAYNQRLALFELYGKMIEKLYD